MGVNILAWACIWLSTVHNVSSGAQLAHHEGRAKHDRVGTFPETGLSETTPLVTLLQFDMSFHILDIF